MKKLLYDDGFNSYLVEGDNYKEIKPFSMEKVKKCKRLFKESL